MSLAPKRIAINASQEIKELHFFEVPANTFYPMPNHAVDVHPSYSLPTAKSMYYDYPDLIQAMENAKKGALSYIKHLIAKAQDGVEELRQYLRLRRLPLLLCRWLLFSILVVRILTTSFPGD